MTERNLRSLITERDPEIQQKVISLSENLGNLKTEKLGSAEKMKDFPTFVGFSGAALRPLIREKNSEVKAAVITLVAKGDERKTEMTRCQEFYEKLEKDGNFCGMSKEDFREAMEYWKNVEKDKTGIPVSSCAAYRRERKEAIRRVKQCPSY